MIDWQRVPLGSVAKVLNGYAFKSSEYVSRGIRIIRITNVQKGLVQDENPKYIDSKRRNEFSNYMLSEGDILLSLTGNVGRSGVLDVGMLPAALNQRVGAVKIRSRRVHSRYVFNLLNSDKFERDAIRNSKGIAQLNLSSKWVESYEIPLPFKNGEIDLSEQKRIAKILDAADGLRAKRRAALAQLDTLLQSTFLDLFGDPVGDTKKRGEKDKKKSVGWIRCKLGDQITLQRGKDITKKSAIPGNVPVISSGGISFYHNHPLISGPGVLLGRKGSVGKVHYVESDYWPHDTTLYVRVFNGNEAIYVYHFFKHFPISQYEASAANPSLNRNNLHPVEVFWPPLALQRQFTSIVESVERQKARHREHLAQLDTLFASLQQRAFKGEL